MLRVALIIRGRTRLSPSRDTGFLQRRRLEATCRPFSSGVEAQSNSISIFVHLRLACSTRLSYSLAPMLIRLRRSGFPARAGEKKSFPNPTRELANRAAASKQIPPYSSFPPLHTRFGIPSHLIAALYPSPPLHTLRSLPPFESLIFASPTPIGALSPNLSIPHRQPTRPSLAMSVASSRALLLRSATSPSRTACTTTAHRHLLLRSSTRLASSFALRHVASSSQQQQAQAQQQIQTGSAKWPLDRRWRLGASRLGGYGLGQQQQRRNAASAAAAM